MNTYSIISCALPKGRTVKHIIDLLDDLTSSYNYIIIIRRFLSWWLRLNSMKCSELVRPAVKIKRNKFLLPLFFNLWQSIYSLMYTYIRILLKNLIKLVFCYYKDKRWHSKNCRHRTCKAYTPYTGNNYRNSRLYGTWSASW